MMYQSPNDAVASFGTFPETIKQSRSFSACIYFWSHEYPPGISDPSSCQFIFFDPSESICCWKGHQILGGPGALTSHLPESPFCDLH
jgi:hypothetical protein